MEEHFIDCQLDQLGVPERLQRLQALREHMESGRAGLPLIRDTNAENRFCWSRGSPTARLLVLGDAPSRTDALSGDTFSGPDGDILTEALQRHGIASDDWYGMYLIKVRPPPTYSRHNNQQHDDGTHREPHYDEICAYAGYALQQILLVRPLVILALGRIAASLVRAQFSTDRLLDVQSLDANGREAMRCRIETLDQALEAYRALRQRRAAASSSDMMTLVNDDVGVSERLTYQVSANVVRGVYAFDMRRARMRLVSLGRLARQQECASLFTVAACGFACRTYVHDAPSVCRERSQGTYRLLLEECQRWSAPLDALTHLLALQPPPVYCMEPNHLIDAAPCCAYARIPTSAFGHSGSDGEGVFYERRVPSSSEMCDRFQTSSASPRPLLFQVLSVEYAQTTNCYEVFGRTWDGLSVCTLVARPSFDFTVRLVHWTWIKALQHSTAGGTSKFFEWLQWRLGTFCSKLMERTPHYERAIPRTSDDTVLQQRRNEFLQLRIELVQRRSLYYVQRDDEPMLRLVYGHRQARAVLEEAVRYVLEEEAWPRLRHRFGLPLDETRVPRVEFFEIDSDPVQQFCLETGVYTSGWMCVGAPLRIVGESERQSYCDLEVSTVMMHCGGMSPKLELTPSYASLERRLLRRQLDEQDVDRDFAALTLPQRWNSNAPYSIMSMDIEVLNVERDKFPVPELCPVVSICAYTKRFSSIAAKAPLFEQQLDAKRRLRPSGRVNYDGAYVFALKSVKPIVAPHYDPATQPDSLHSGIAGVREQWTREQALYGQRLGVETGGGSTDLVSSHLLSHFCLEASCDPEAPEDERLAGRHFIGSLALARFRLSRHASASKRLSWALVATVLPLLLQGDATVVVQDAAQRHFLAWLRLHYVSAHEWLALEQRQASMFATADCWLPPRSPHDWDEILQVFGESCEGLLECQGLKGAREDEALSTWNAPPYEWLVGHGAALLRRFTRLYPRAHDRDHMIFEPPRLLTAFLQRCPHEDDDSDQTQEHPILQEAARLCHWYAFRPVPKIFCFDTEEELLEAFAHFSVDYDPDVLTGYNILKFDYPYLLERQRVLGLMPRRFRGIYQLSRMRQRESTVERKTFESRAFGQRVLVSVSMAGRCFFDCLDYVLREKKYTSYKLGHASQQMLGDTKDDVPHTVIYSLFLRDRERLHRYCLKDAELCMRMLALENVLGFAQDMVRLVSCMNVGDLYVKGQQARVVSLLLRHMRLCAPSLLLPTQRSSKQERPAVSTAPDAERLYQEHLSQGATEQPETVQHVDNNDGVFVVLRRLEAMSAGARMSSMHADVDPEAAVLDDDDRELDDATVDELIAGANRDDLRADDDAYERSFERDRIVLKASEGPQQPAKSRTTTSSSRKRTVQEALSTGARENGFAKKRKTKAREVGYEGAYVFEPVHGLWTDSPIVCFD